jgi:FG-GAP-like repeat/PKD domain/FG-GAP repeat
MLFGSKSMPARGRGGERRPRRARHYKLLLEALETRELLSGNPAVQSFAGNTTGNPDPYIAGNLLTSSRSISYTLTFNEPVTGVVSSDFVTTGTLAPTLLAGSIQATQDPNNPDNWIVTVNGITGEGTLGLNLVDGASISDLAGNGLSLGGGTVVGQVYTDVPNPPIVLSFVGATPADPDPNFPYSLPAPPLLTNASSLSWTLAFSEPVTGVNAADFTALNILGGYIGGILGAVPIQVTPIAASNGAAYTITATGIPNSGAIAVFINDPFAIKDQSGFAFNLTTASTVPNDEPYYTVVSQPYTIDRVPPIVSITPTSPASPASLVTSASSVSYAVTFSKPVTGVDLTDFVLAETGTVATTSTQVTLDPNIANSWIVTIGGITGDGTLGLQLVNNNHIVDLAGNALPLAFAPVTLQSLPTITLGQGQSLMAVADVNGDGKDDLIIANSLTNSMSVMLGNGNGTFQNPQPFAVGVAPFDGVLADVNGDGKPDIVMVNSGTDSISVLMNNGDGTFQSPQTYITSNDGTVAEAVAVADINGDGKPDIVVANADSYDRIWQNPKFGESGNVSVLLNNGDGTFQPPQTLIEGYPVVNAYSLAVASVNGDGKPVIAVGTAGHYYYATGFFQQDYSARVVLLSGDGSGNFPNSLTLMPANNSYSRIPANNAPLQVAVTDLNGDGKPDVVFGSSSGSTTVELNNGDGTFTKAISLPQGAGPAVPFGADLTGNGKVEDLVVSNPGANTVNVFLNVPPVYTIDTPTAHIAANANATQAADTANLLLTATDPLGSQELAAGFTYSINWGDGSLQTLDPTANNGSGVPVNHTYTADGSYLVSVTATNKDGAVSSDATSLAVMSSHAGDSIALSGGAGAGPVAVSVDNATAATFSPTDLVLVSGQGGNDAFTVNFGSALTTPISLAGSNSAGDTLTVNGDSSATNVITKTPGQITWGNPVTETVSRSGITNTIINANGTSQNYINDPGGSTTINGGPGANSITIAATTGTGVVIHGGGSTNTYIVDLGSLAGPVTIQNSNSGATNSLVVNGATGNNTISAAGNQVTSGAQTITDTAALTNLTVNGGSGNNQITVSNLSVPVQMLSLDGGGGNNTFTLINAGTDVGALDINGGGTGTNAVQVQGSLPANVQPVDITPVLTVTDAGGTYKGATFAATATVTGISGSAASSLEGVSPTLTYYAGSSPTGTPLSGAPTNVGTYTVLATFAGSTDYTPASASATFTISQATLTVVTNNSVMLHGNNPPPLTGSVNGTPFTGSINYTTAYGDQLTVTLSTAATSTSAVGVYPIVATVTGAATANYYVQTTTGNMNVVTIAPGSIYVLDPTAGGALTLSGNADINIPGNLVVDSNSSSALSASGNAAVHAAAISVKGNFKKSGNATLSPTPVTGISSIADPLASLSLPSLTGLTNYGAVSVAGNSTVTLSPGIYTSIQMSGNAIVTMSPGTYIIKGGGFSVSGNARVSGSGVFIFNAGSSYNGTTDGGSFGATTLSGNGTISLTPPTSGTYNGILIFQARDNTKALTFSGNSMQGTNGTIYAPAAQLVESGNAQIGSSSNPISLIVDTLSISGNGVAQLVSANGGIAYTPAQIRSAYGINNLSLDGTGQTIAIVEAYNDPQLYEALDTFDSQFGLTSSGPNLFDQYGAATSFLTILNQYGQPTSLPTTDPNGPGTDNWEVETALDVEWAHAIAPGAQIVVVEANSQALSDLMAGVAIAASQPGVSVVSMSWGFAEGQSVFSADENAYDSYFVHPGVTFVASTGDYGAAGAVYPAFSPNVLAVGGTSLSLNADGSYDSETGWGYNSDSMGTFVGSGGGLSQYESEPAFQQGVQSTGSRTTPDVSFLADPATGAWVADPYNLDPSNPWEVVGGTSLAAPCWAGLIALTNQGRIAAGQQTLNNSSPTETQSDLYTLSQSDYATMTAGSNGYSAGAGYNLVTGLGTPVANLLVPDLVAGNFPSSGQVSPISAADLIYSGTSGDSDGQANVMNVFAALPVAESPYNRLASKDAWAVDASQTFATSQELRIGRGVNVVDFWYIGIVPGTGGAAQRGYNPDLLFASNASAVTGESRPFELLGSESQQAMLGGANSLSQVDDGVSGLTARLSFDAAWTIPMQASREALDRVFAEIGQGESLDSALAWLRLLPKGIGRRQ